MTLLPSCFCRRPFAVPRHTERRMQIDDCRVVFLPLESCAFGSSGAWQPRQVYFCRFIFSLLLLAPLLTLATTSQFDGVERRKTASPCLCVGSFLWGIYLAHPRRARAGGYHRRAPSLRAASRRCLEMMITGHKQQISGRVKETFASYVLDGCVLQSVS